MATKWKDIRKQHSPEVEEQIHSWVCEEVSRLPLADLRRARSLTQVRMAELLEMDQGSVSKIENRADMYIRTLRSYIEAMGGELHLVASFPDGEVLIEHLGNANERELVEA